MVLWNHANGALVSMSTLWEWSEASFGHLIINVFLGVAWVLNQGFIVPLWGTQLMGTIEPNLKPLIYPPVEELSEILVQMTL